MYGVPRVQIEGKRFVILSEREYKTLCRSAGRSLTQEVLPALPEPDARGRYPAVEFARASIARDLIGERRALSLTQQQLAKLADVRQETLSRIETGKHTASVRTLDRISQALATERYRQARKRRTPSPPRASRH